MVYAKRAQVEQLQKMNNTSVCNPNQPLSEPFVCGCIVNDIMSSFSIKHYKLVASTGSILALAPELADHM